MSCGRLSGRALEIILDRSHRLIISRLSCGKITEKTVYLILRHISCYRYNRCDCHGIFSYGSCLIYTEHIYSRKSLDALHIVDKHLLKCKSHCTYRKCSTGYEEKSLRYHSYD